MIINESDDAALRSKDGITVAQAQKQGVCPRCKRAWFPDQIGCGYGCWWPNEKVPLQLEPKSQTTPHSDLMRGVYHVEAQKLPIYALWIAALGGFLLGVGVTLAYVKVSL